MGDFSNKTIINRTKNEFFKQIKAYQKTLKPTKEIEGFGSAPIVGEKNYPFLQIHNSSNEDKANNFMNSGEIVKQGYKDIFELKAKNILGSTQNTHIRRTTDRINNEIIDIYKSKKAIEFNSTFETEIKFDKVLTNKFAGVVGSKNELESLNATENTATNKQIEKYESNDAKAKEAVIKLYEKGENEQQIIHLLALGIFGVSINKKLVPSKWAITAYDTMIQTHLHKKILKYNPINQYEVYYYQNKSDTHVNILLPDNYMGTHTEDWANSYSDEWNGFNVDWFNNSNKLSTPEALNAGGYYATKIALNEHLNSRKKQAAAIMIRRIRDYDVPLGVVFVRECVRESFKHQVFKTSSFSELDNFIKTKFPDHYKHFINSKVLKEQKKQTKLNQFFKV
jgi:hypothetical protein